MLAALAEVERVAQLLGDEARLVVLARAVLVADDLLEPDHVGVQLPQHRRDARRPHAPVKSLALVDVVGDDAHKKLLAIRH